MNIYQGWEVGKTYCEKLTKNSGLISFGLVERINAKDMIIKNHYSKKWNTQFGKLNIGIFKDGVLKGVAVFGRCMNPRSFKKIIDSEDIDSILELNRLWISDELGKNSETILISICFKYIKHNLSYVRAVQSFADGRLGCGTIYKASNFKYYGSSKSIFFEHISGEIFHKVPMENTKRPTGFKKLNTYFMKGELKPIEVNTYRYIYVLNKKDKGILLKEKPYPDYSKGFEYTDYKPTCNQACKFVYLLKKEKLEYSFARDYIKQNYDVDRIKDSWQNAVEYFESDVAE